VVAEKIEPQLYSADALTVFMLARVSILRLAMDPIIHSRHRRKLNGQAKMLSKLKTPFSEGENRTARMD